MKNKITLLFIFTFAVQLSFAQTDIDAIMMNKKEFCAGLMFGSGSWENYWEGTNKRDNANFGTVSSKEYSVQGNYGIKSNLNVLFSLPYISTKATSGTLQSMKGLQDFSLFIKYMPIEKEIGPGVFSVYTIGGVSFPTTNYVADFLPLSIGLHSTNLSFRGMFDYQISSWFATISGTYIQRSNVKIDRTSYYTTALHYSNEVRMPDATSFNVRTGFRNEKLIAEAVLNNWTTQGGFDITKNNMPFLSNKMNSTTIGFNGKYYIEKAHNFSITGGFNYTVAGRNVGQNTHYNIGTYYVFNIGKNQKNTPAVKAATGKIVN
jgi:hypothetical protein